MYAPCRRQTEKDILDVNNRIAEKNAARFRAHGIRAIDLLGAIGSERLH